MKSFIDKIPTVKTGNSILTNLSPKVYCWDKFRLRSTLWMRLAFEYIYLEFFFIVCIEVLLFRLMKGLMFLLSINKRSKLLQEIITISKIEWKELSSSSKIWSIKYLRAKFNQLSIWVPNKQAELIWLHKFILVILPWTE